MSEERLRYFRLLGIQPTENQNVIKKAYRKMAFKYHPDTTSSADAHLRFIEITEAYEVLTGQKKIKTEPLKTKSEEENIAEKVAFAKARYKYQQEEEARKDAIYFANITGGWKWRWFKVGAVYSAIISVFLIIDYFAVGSYETIERSEASIIYYHQMILSDNEKFRVDEHAYWNSDYYGQIRGHRTLILHDLNQISVVLNPPTIQTDRHSSKLIQLDTFDNYELFTVVSFDSMYGSFPLVQFFLFVPLLLVIYKRPVLRFSIWRLVSIYIIFPVALFILISNDRFFHMIGLI